VDDHGDGAACQAHPGNVISGRASTRRAIRTTANSDTSDSQNDGCDRGPRRPGSPDFDFQP
jgi:hypothetical protein